MALAPILHRLVPALGLAQDSNDLLVGKSLLHRVLLASRIKENSLAEWRQETSQVNRKLGAGEYIRLTIKCPRCRAMNVLRAERRLPAGRRVSATRGSLHATTHFR
ncbi:Com family DNA-binding transcriptional regulator [Burkholderia multivorans]|uniref:Com family DNA-binding transcriptional regulator n=1 Tax=Burkholderia multivorans TaxID=87883 RepID=UPI00311A5551